MNELTPLQSASLAEDIYALTRFLKFDDAIGFLNAKYGSSFTVATNSIVKGKTGGPGIIKSRTAFGVVLQGQGKFKGQAFIVFRGTKYLADWLTNLNMSVSPSNFGQPVHDGFNKAFKSMEPKLRGFVDSLAPGTVTVHCIGHSLGGALATICAEWLKKSGNKKPYLYTYGSPRVGLQGFSSTCSNKIGAKSIFRAYHKTDIVPCIPFWPFMHLPINNNGYYLQSPGSIPWKEYHKMEHYVASVRASSWASLKSQQAARKSEVGIMQWLKGDSPIGLSISTIEWLGDALLFVLKKCSDIGATLISQSFTTTFTLMDNIAYILNKGVNLASEFSSWVVMLINKIMSLLGMGSVLDDASITRDFIRNIFMRLSHKISEYTQRALDGVLVEGTSA